jgi:hypothetical protein
MQYTCCQVDIQSPVLFLGRIVSFAEQTRFVRGLKAVTHGMQVQTALPGDLAYVGALQQLRTTVAQGGLKSLYHGTAVTLLRDAPSYGLYFALFEVRVLIPSSMM